MKNVGRWRVDFRLWAARTSSRPSALLAGALSAVIHKTNMFLRWPEGWLKLKPCPGCGWLLSSGVEYRFGGKKCKCAVACLCFNLAPVLPHGVWHGKCLSSSINLMKSVGRFPHGGGRAKRVCGDIVEQRTQGEIPGGSSMDWDGSLQDAERLLKLDTIVPKIEELTKLVEGFKAGPKRRRK